MPLTWRAIMLLALGLGLLAGPVAAQQAPMTPMTAPPEPDALVLGTGGVVGSPGHETWFEQWGDPFVRNVTTATLTPVLPDPDRATGAAVIVAPGGGFLFLSMGNEGWEVARALADRGVAAFVLKYRTRPTPLDPVAFEAAVTAMFSGAARPSEASGNPFANPVEDAAAAFALVRERAEEWRIDPARIGMVGFSAGAMTTLATTLSSPEVRPAFIGAIYGPQTAVDVPSDAPPMFVALAADDPLFAHSGFGLVESWRAAGRPVEFHLYQDGGHGFGLGNPGKTSHGWLEVFLRWLEANGLLDDPREDHGV